MRLRTAALGIVLPFAVPAHAQFFGGSITRGLQTLRDNQLIAPYDQKNPTQPSGNPLPPPQRSGDLPREGDLGPDGGAFTPIEAGVVDRKGDQIHITGGVEFTNRGYHCWADELFGDAATSTYTLVGHVKVLGQDESIYGETVQVNFDHKTFVADDSDATLKPHLVQGRLRDNLYVKGHHSYGSRQEIFGEHTSTTTCSYPDPHFEIVAERTDVRPGRRIIFRKAKIKILGHTVLNLPYLSIPLDDRTYNNLPVVGRDSIAGYFIKNRYSFPFTADSVFLTRLDYFSKLGTGFGGGINWNKIGSQGRFSIYTIQGARPELEILGNLRQNMKWGTLTLDSSYENDNYLISSVSRILNTRALLFIPQGRSSDRLTYYRSSNDSPDTTSLQQTISVNDTRFWNSKLNTVFDANLSDNTSNFSGGSVHREQLDINFKAVDDLEKAQARLDYIRSIPIGESSNFFTTSDVTPAFTLLSDSRRLMGQAFDLKFPFQTQLSYGEYGDPITKGRITRADYDFSFTNGRATNQKHWVLNYQGEYKQDIYSDDTAQFVLRGGTQLIYNFHDNSHWQISYNYLRPYGYTPLQIDRRGQSNNFVSDLSYTPIKHLMLGLATGYDFNLVKEHQPTPWQQVGIRAEYKLGNTFSARALSTYDTTQHNFSSTRFDLTMVRGGTYLSLGAKYDGQRNKWAAANMFLDGLQLGRLRVSTLLNYNGYTKQFDAMHYSFIYDLHCAEAVLQIIDNPTGFNGGRAIYFFIRLKALPFDTPFGTGTQGQPIGTGTGRDF
ncbi:MAG TPA: hypothetical protein VHE55_10410 [Fimbriimonadaceae bacterium]|nr:hypothetical protein [Fimbriimonadaceae bacterium]